MSTKARDRMLARLVARSSTFWLITSWANVFPFNPRASFLSRSTLETASSKCCRAMSISNSSICPSTHRRFCCLPSTSIRTSALSLKLSELSSIPDLRCPSNWLRVRNASPTLPDVSTSDRSVLRRSSTVLRKVARSSFLAVSLRWSYR